MSVQLDKKNKTYTVRWYETNKVTGERIQRAKRGFTTKKEARLFEEEIENIKDFASFSQIKDLYIDSLKGYALDETRKDKNSMANRYAADLMPLNVRHIKKTDIIAWRNKIADIDRSTTVKNKILQLVKSISRFGAEVYEYPDFAKFLKPFPKSSDDVREMMVLSPDDFNSLMEYVPYPIYKNFYTFLYHTGMRRGEAMALQKKSIITKDNKHYAKIEYGIEEHTNKLKTLKNPQSKRTILLDDIAYKMIEPLMELEGDFIFGGEAVIPPTNITRNFNKALEAAGFPHYRIHDLRHSFVSNAILNGIDIVTVSKYVGHSNIERTLNTYSHLFKDSEEKMIEKLNQIHRVPD